MKILLAAQYYFPYRSGLTEYARLLAEGLAARGHAVTVLTSRSSPDLPQEERINGVSVIRMPVLFRLDRGAFMPGFLPALVRLKKSHDVVNLHFPMPECLPAACLTRNTPNVVTYHCDMTLGDGLAKRALESVYYGMLKWGLRYTRAIAASSLEYATASAISGYLQKVSAIPPPIKVLSRKDPAGFKARYSVTGGPVIGFLGRVVFEKGLEDLVHAMDLIRPAFPGAVLVIAGEKEKAAGGTVTARLAELAEKHGDRVVLTGFLEDGLVEAFYSACDVFVLPSVDRLEAFGMVQVEAMLCGTPVVAADRPGMDVPVRATGMGRLAPPKNPKALAEAILDVLRNRAQYVKDRADVLRHFGVEKTVDDYEKLFKRVIGDQGIKN